MTAKQAVQKNGYLHDPTTRVRSDIDDSAQPKSAKPM